MSRNGIGVLENKELIYRMHSILEYTLMVHLNSSEQRIKTDLLGNMEVSNSVYYGI